jgi:hypothetical protein
VPAHRFPIANPSGLPEIAYRVGDFASFRRSLLDHLPGEVELAEWRPTATADLGMQVLEWWAYVADVLTFYNERIANQSFLGTADLEESVTRLTSLLGYRPRPAIGAIATLAVMASGPGPLKIPAGVAIASKATPDVASQTFETTASAAFVEPTTVPRPAPDDFVDDPDAASPPRSSPPGTAEPAPHSQLIARGGVLVKGAVSSLRTGDRLLLMTKAWSSANDPAVVVSLRGMVTEKDSHGRKNTRMLLDGTSSLPASALAKDYRLARSTQVAHLASLPSGATVVGNSLLVLDGPARALKAGDPLLVEVPGAGVGSSPGSGFDVVRLTAYAEQLWFANAPDASKPHDPPTGGGAAPGIPLVVGSLSVDSHSGSSLGTRYSGQAPTVSVRGSWTDVGTLLDTPVATVTSLPGTLRLAAPPAAAAGVSHPAIVEDANGIGTRVVATPKAGSAEVAITAADDTAMPRLQTPLRLLWDLVTVTRGSTVRDESLGVGDAVTPHQEFQLSKSPVTYLTDAPGRSGDGYSSTVVIAVDGRLWTEVPTLFGSASDDAVFETYVDEVGSTHVRFGDGEAGRRLATGAKVTATYRIGAGGAVPPSGALSQVLTAVPNLRSVRNPVAPYGGADAEPRSAIRTLAPRSVLTFGRAISGDDYATVAAAAPGVHRAAVEWEFDPVEQRPTVRVYVGDDAGAVASARARLQAQADPNRHVVVVPAVECRASLRIAVEVAADFVTAMVSEAVASALVDGLFAPGVLDLGRPLYRSRVEEVVCAVPGVVATYGIRMSWVRENSSFRSFGPRFEPGPGGFFTLTRNGLHLVNGDQGDV